MAPIIIAALLTLLAAIDAAAEQDVEQLRIAEPRTHWLKNFIPLVPAIHAPTTHDREDLIHVWLHVPEEVRIDVRWLEDQQRHTLVYPSGTVADRVEYYYLGDETPPLSRYAPFGLGDAGSASWTVADVRGTRMTDEGQRFHVYRPVSGAPHAALAGWSWPRGSSALQRRATDLLAAHAHRTGTPVHDAPLSQSGVERLRALNDCASCHVPDRPSIATGNSDRRVERATDAMGFIVPNAVMQDECVVVHHRPEDVNTEDPYVRVICDDGSEATLVEDNEREWFDCKDGSPPRGRRDVAAGMAADHPYTVAVCKSRRALHERMTARARRAFADSFRVCGIK